MTCKISRMNIELAQSFICSFGLLGSELLFRNFLVKMNEGQLSDTTNVLLPACKSVCNTGAANN